MMASLPKALRWHCCFCMLKLFSLSRYHLSGSEQKRNVESVTVCYWIESQINYTRDIQTKQTSISNMKTGHITNHFRCTKDLHANV